jgi:hypothetical protein
VQGRHLLPIERRHFRVEQRWGLRCLGQGTLRCLLRASS